MSGTERQRLIDALRPFAANTHIVDKLAGCVQCEHALKVARETIRAIADAKDEMTHEESKCQALMDLLK